MGTLKRLGLALLAVSAALQGGRLVAGTATPDAAPWPPAEVVDALRGSDAFPAGTVILAFHPECAHTPAVAEEWSRWIDAMDRAGTDLRLVTRAEEADARRYLDEQGWKGTLRTIADGEPLARMASRTPWIFVVGSDGDLAFEGHGSEWRDAEKARTAWTNRQTTGEDP